MLRRTHVVIASALLSILAGAAFGAAPAQSNVAAGVPVDAIWKVQSFEFAYGGLSTAYSCGSLRRRVRAILTRMGAHESTVVRTQACYDLSSLATVRITMAAPVEATPENVRAATQYDSRDELIARVRGETLASSADIERFPAAWRTISFSRDKELKLAPGDCELVEQLRHEVFPRMSVRVVQDNLRCSRAFGAYVRPQLTVEALVAAPDAAGERVAHAVEDDHTEIAGR